MCVQGFGGPCCARILTSWFATKERGTYWGMWNIAHNLGGFGAPILAGTAARYYGWKWGEPPRLTESKPRATWGIGDPSRMRRKGFNCSLGHFHDTEHNGLRTNRVINNLVW